MKILDEKHFYKVDGTMILSLCELSQAIDEGNMTNLFIACGKLAEKFERLTLIEVK